VDESLDGGSAQSATNQEQDGHVEMPGTQPLGPTYFQYRNQLPNIEGLIIRTTPRCSPDWEYKLFQPKGFNGMLWRCNCGKKSEFYYPHFKYTDNKDEKAAFRSWMEHLHPDWDWVDEERFAELMNWLYPKPTRSKVSWRRVWRRVGELPLTSWTCLMTCFMLIWFALMIAIFAH
jgi:hypothetical protein